MRKMLIVLSVVSIILLMSVCFQGPVCVQAIKTSHKNSVNVSVSSFLETNPFLGANRYDDNGHGILYWLLQYLFSFCVFIVNSIGNIIAITLTILAHLPPYIEFTIELLKIVPDLIKIGVEFTLNVAVVVLFWFLLFFAYLKGYDLHFPYPY